MTAYIKCIGGVVQETGLTTQPKSGEWYKAENGLELAEYMDIIVDGILVPSFHTPEEISLMHKELGRMAKAHVLAGHTNLQIDTLITAFKTHLSQNPAALFPKYYKLFELLHCQKGNILVEIQNQVARTVLADEVVFPLERMGQVRIQSGHAQTHTLASPLDGKSYSIKFDNIQHASEVHINNSSEFYIAFNASDGVNNPSIDITIPDTASDGTPLTMYLSSISWDIEFTNEDPVKFYLLNGETGATIAYLGTDVDSFRFSPSTRIRKLRIAVQNKGSSGWLRIEEPKIYLRKI